MKWSEVAQLCLILCNLMGCSLPGPSVHGIFQAIELEWIAISFSSRSSWPRDWTWVSHIIDICFHPLSHQGSLYTLRICSNLLIQIYMFMKLFSVGYTINIRHLCCTDQFSAIEKNIKIFLNNRGSIWNLF